ncbi:MAG: hypothetical protein IH588_14495 [Anaerolineales bacterium]|nr:hypothetical protein [Anaerolineales bacterium]
MMIKLNMRNNSVPVARNFESFRQASSPRFSSFGHQLNLSGKSIVLSSDKCPLSLKLSFRTSGQPVCWREKSPQREPDAQGISPHSVPPFVEMTTFFVVSFIARTPVFIETQDLMLEADTMKLTRSLRTSNFNLPTSQKHNRIQNSGTETKTSVSRLRTSDSFKILIRAGWGQPEDFLFTKTIFQMKNVSFTAMTPEDLATCKSSLTALEALLPENPVLTPVDRRRLAKISYVGQTFVQEALNLSKDMPELKSSFVDLDQMEGNLNFHQQMNDLLTNVGTLQHWLEDLMMLSGSSVDDMARACYKNIQTASSHGIVSASLAYDRLKGRYKRRPYSATLLDGNPAAGVSSN